MRGDPIRLWTVQPAEVGKQIESAGEAWVDRNRLRGGWVHPQYSWLAWQMRSRLADSRGGLPWFAYAARPDLRWVRHARPEGEENLLLEIEAPDGAAIVFPCWAWHDVFCQQYLALNGTDHRDWHRRVRETVGVIYWDHEGRLPEPLQSELEASWARLFHEDLPARSWRRRDRRPDREGVLEVLRKEWLVRVTPFVGTGRWYKVRKPAR